MSRENLELARRAVAAVAARDYDTINAVFHPDHVFTPVMGRVEGPMRGGEGFRDYLRKQRELEMEWELEVEGAVDLAEDKVVFVGTYRMRAERSGMELERRLWTVLTFRDGKVWRSEAHSDPDLALQAALGDAPEA